jgi:nucleotide-binding universal stress UspA family protein
MFETVVVALDGSALAELALSPAVEIADLLDAELRLLRVVGPGADRSAAQHDLEAVAGRLSRPAHVDVVEGDWVAEAIAHAAAAPDTLLCLTSHASSGVRRVVLGSVAEDVLRLHPHPVVLVGPEAGRAPPIARGAKLLICTDGSPVSETIVPVAQAWIARLSLEPWVVSVVDQATVAGSDDSDTIESAHVERIARQLGADERSGGWDVLHDRDPARALVGFSGGLPASLITMATHGTTGLARVTIGSVAAGVVRRAQCPVLVLRPTRLRDTDIGREQTSGSGVG